MSEGTAHQLSTMSALGAFGGLFWWLQRRWPIATGDDAARIGSAWLVLTVTFEFGFGRAVAKHSWQELLAEYDLRKGRTWPLVLVWLAAGPAVVRKLQPRN